MYWKWQKIEDLSGLEMHQILAVRQQVFVVEQSCVYCDADDYDHISYHLSCRDEDGWIAAYARLNFPGSRFAEPSIGRLLTAEAFRGKGLAKEALRRAISKCRKEFSDPRVTISAQLYLQNFYENFGFSVVGQSYLEDGIGHINMVLEL